MRKDITTIQELLAEVGSTGAIHTAKGSFSFAAGWTPGGVLCLSILSKLDVRNEERVRRGLGKVSLYRLPLVGVPLLKGVHLFEMGRLKAGHGLRMFGAKLNHQSLRFFKALSDSSLSISVISILLFTFSQMFTTIVLTVGVGQIETRLQLLDARLSPLVADGKAKSNTGHRDLEGVGETHPSTKPISPDEASRENAPANQ